MTGPLPMLTDRVTVGAPGEPPNNVEPSERPLPAGGECLLWVVSRPQRPRALTDRSWSKQTFTVHPGYRSAAGAMAGAAEEGGPVTLRLCHPAWYSSRRPVQAEGRAQQDGDDRQSGQDQEDHPVSFREQKWVNADERQGSRVQRVKNCPSVYSPLG